MCEKKIMITLYSCRTLRCFALIIENVRISALRINREMCFIIMSVMISKMENAKHLRSREVNL